MTKALWHLSSQHSAINEVKLAVPLNDQWVRVKSLYSLVSTGTEYLVASGNVPTDLYQSMKVPYMEGQFSFPIKYGYSLVGEVTSKGPFQDKMVHLLHPHQNQCWVSSENIFEVPKEVPSKRATLASNLETALNAIWDSKVSIGDKVLVIGFGMIGALVARLLSFLPAVEVLILEKNPTRKNKAKAMGFEPFDDSNEQAFDLAFHTSSSAEGLQIAIEKVGFEGKVIEMSWYGIQKVALSLGGSFHQMRKQIISSQVGHLPIEKTSRWDYRRRKEVVFQLLKNPIFDEHITHLVPFEESPQFFQQLRSRNLPDGLGWCIDYTTTH